MRQFVCWTVSCVLLFINVRPTYSEEFVFNTFWSGGTNSTWTDAGGIFSLNWSSGIPTTSSLVGLGNGDGGIGIGIGGTSLNLSGTAQAGSIVFYQNPDADDPITRSYNVGNSGQLLTMGADGSITVRGTVAANQTFGANVSGNGALTIRNESNTVNSQLLFSGAVSANSGNLLTVETKAGNSVKFNGDISASGIRIVGSGDVIFGNGGQTASGGIVVEGGRLSGLAAIESNLTVGNGSTYSPGNGIGSVGVQTVGGDLTFASGSIFQWDLTNINTEEFDSVKGNDPGTLTFATGANNVLNLGAGSFDPFASWEVTVFSGFSNVQGLFGEPLTLIGINPGVSASQFKWSVDGTNVNLAFSAVPEPSSLALLGLSTVVGYVVNRRRKSRKAGRAEV